MGLSAILKAGPVLNRVVAERLVGPGKVGGMVVGTATVAMMAKAKVTAKVTAKCKAQDKAQDKTQDKVQDKVNGKVKCKATGKAGFKVLVEAGKASKSKTAVTLPTVVADVGAQVKRS